MGKLEEDEFSPTSTAIAVALSIDEANSRRDNNKGCFSNLTRFVKLKCIFALLLGFSVLISVLFWLPPFLKLSDLADKDLDPRFRGHAIVASFKLQKPLSFVKENVSQLEADIYNELEAANTKVVILSLEDSGLNSTNVVFGIDPLSKRSKISLYELSLIRSNFGFFVTRENKLLLTTSLFGEPSFFEVLKFPGGITIRPPQHVYPLQKVQIYFNFTLNNSILQIQENFDALLDQLNSGLHLTPQENLYIRLTNSRGSTVAPPSTVQTSVVLTVGVPSLPRMKQLAKTIKDSPARNLGLNNTVFGKVKQVSLSSILPASGASSPAPAPSPGPLPHFYHHHHHHHHHHHNHQSTYIPPATAPSYPPPGKGYQGSPPGAPSPVKSYHASSPGCSYRFKSKHFGKSPQHSPAHIAVAPSIHRQAKPPTPVKHQISPSGRLPYVIYARAHPPVSGTEMNPKPPDKKPSVAPLPSSGGRIIAAYWILSLLVALVLRP